MMKGLLKKFATLTVLVSISAFGWVFLISADEEDELVKRTHVVGDSKEIILQVLRESYRNPVCFGDFVETYAPRFEGVRYGAGGKGCSEMNTLINVKQMDCVTFAENLLAMAKTAEELRPAYLAGDTAYFSDNYLFRAFVQNLNRVRYYKGANCGWSTRVHYFTDALRQLDQMAWLEDVGVFLGERYEKKINYISNHKRSFPGIQDWNHIAQLEQQLSEATRYFIPLSEIYRYEQFAQTGDIVALTTDVAGLDVSHVGIIHVEDGNLYMTHASSKAGEVVIKADFCDYMGRRTTITGLVVYRPRIQHD